MVEVTTDEDYSGAARNSPSTYQVAPTSGYPRKASRRPPSTTHNALPFESLALGPPFRYHSLRPPTLRVGMAHLARTSSRKILVCGAFGTGKSTLVRLVAAALSNMGVDVLALGETPRRCPFALNHDQTTLASAWLIGEQIRAEVEAATHTSGVLICDRGIPDILSHTTTLNDEEPQVSLRVIQELSAGWAKTYDLVFWARLDPELPIEADDLRLSDKDYQILLEEHIAKVFANLLIVPITLPRANEDRVSIVLQETLKLLK